MNAVVALIVLLLTITSASSIGVSFALEDMNGNRFEYPVPGYLQEGPSGGWYGASGSADLTYNQSGLSYNAYSKGPDSPHIIWKHQMYPGGTYGAGMGGKNWGFIDGGSIQDYGSGPIIAGGKIVYSHNIYGDSQELLGQLRCVDEMTGEELWCVETERPYGNIFFYNHLAQYSGALVVMGYSSSWIRVHDANTGALVAAWDLDSPARADIIIWEENVLYNRMSAEIYGTVIGDITVNGENKMYAHALNNPTSANPDGTTYLWGPIDTSAGNVYPVYGDYFIAWYPQYTLMSGINWKTGQKLWEKPMQGFCRGVAGYGNFYHKAGDGYIWCIDMATGEIEWKSEVVAGTGYWTEHGACVGNGVFVDGNYDGGVYCFDAFTGKLRWVRYMGPTPYEPYSSWYGTTPYGGAPAAMSGDGIVYQMNGDHMQHDPNPAGQLLRAFDVETGDILWEVPSTASSHVHRMAIADGVLFVPNEYTNELQAFGKGPTATEVSVDASRISKGDYVWITGHVTDQSPAQQGTPAVSRESMQAWMTYLHLGTSDPGAKTGVPVAIYAEDSTGNVFEVGTATTDGDTGLFRYKWIPPTEDNYEITAVFFGDDSYWDSHGETTLTVAGASASTTSLSVATGSIALVAVLCIVVGFDLFRRKKEKIIK